MLTCSFINTYVFNIHSHTTLSLFSLLFIHDSALLAQWWEIRIYFPLFVLRSSTSCLFYVAFVCIQCNPSRFQWMIKNNMNDWFNNISSIQSQPQNSFKIILFTFQNNDINWNVKHMAKNNRLWAFVQAAFYKLILLLNCQIYTTNPLWHITVQTEMSAFKSSSI